MKYAKPELVSLAAALNAVQGSPKKANRIPVDSFTNATSAAYEADE